MNLKEYIRSIPDYPKKGILFRDITTLIKDENAFEETINQIIERSKNLTLLKLLQLSLEDLYLLQQFHSYLKNHLLCLEKKINYRQMFIQLIFSLSMELRL